MKSVFIIAIVAVAMIGVMVPSVDANHNPQTTLIENGGTFDKEGKWKGCFADRGSMVFSFEDCPDEWWEKQADIEWEEFVQKAIEKGGIVCAKFSSPPYEKYFLTEGWEDGVEGKYCPERYIRVMNSGSLDHSVLVDPYRIINCPEGTTSVSVGKNHDCLPIKNENIFSDLTDNIISESSKVISEYSQDSDVMIKQNTESVKDTSDKKLVCPSNSYFGMDNDGNVVCRDLKTNEIVPSISTNKPITDDSVCGSGTIMKNGKCVVEESEGGGCLIATATYGSELAPQVQQLRELRDNQLLQTESGSAFMSTFNDVYYSFSPIIADYERENPYFKETVKLAITPMISTLSLMENAESESEVLGIGISVIALNLGMYLGVPAIVIVGIKKRFKSNIQNVLPIHYLQTHLFYNIL